MDVWNSLFGDPSDDSMYVPVTFEANGKQRTWSEFDPSTPSSKKWLDQFANKCVTTGTKVHHISNNAPRDICELDETNGAVTRDEALLVHAASPMLVTPIPERTAAREAITARQGHATRERQPRKPCLQTLFLRPLNRNVCI